jgi:hypothetical protein
MHLANSCFLKKQRKNFGYSGAGSCRVLWSRLYGLPAFSQALLCGNKGLRLGGRVDFGAGRGGRFGNHHHRRTQQPAVQQPGFAPSLQHRAGRMFGGFLLGHRLMEIRIEGGAGGVAAGDVVAFQQGHEGAFDAFKAVAQLGNDLRLRVGALGQAVDAALEVLRSFNNVFGKFLYGVEPGFLDLAFGTGASCIRDSGVGSGWASAGMGSGCCSFMAWN